MKKLGFLALMAALFVASAGAMTGCSDTGTEAPKTDAGTDKADDASTDKADDADKTDESK